MILVTGAAGFIGSNLIAALDRRDAARLVVCDRLGEGEKWRNLVKHGVGEIVPPDELFQFLSDNAYAMERIYHLGAISSTTERDADLILRVNFRLSQKIWNWCAEHGVPLVYASSAATYGDGAEGFSDDPARPALARLRPLNPYGWSKHLFDRWVADQLAGGEKAPPQWAGLKFFNVYGPNEYHKGAQQSVVPQLFSQIQETGRARLFKSHNPDYADGQQKRDFIWVGDCIEIMLWLADNPAIGGLFNCGTGQARSFADMAKAVFGALGREPAIDYIPTPEALRDKYQYFTCAEMGRLRNAGYDREFTSLEDGVRTYVGDYLNTEDPYA